MRLGIPALMLAITAILLAAVQPAAAEVIYTPINQTLSGNGFLDYSDIGQFP